MYFLVEQQDVDAISFTFPENATTTPDFTTFWFSYNVSDFDYFYKTKVDYKPDDGPITWIDESNSINKHSENPTC